MLRTLPLAAVLMLSGVVMCALVGCGEDEEPVGYSLDAGGSWALPGFRRLSDGLAYGGRPHGERGFLRMQAEGLDTLVCVEALEPDVAAAAAHGVRVVHIPLGFGMLDQDTCVRLTAAVRGASKGAYVYCNNGALRAPAAAIIAHKAIAELGIEEVINALLRAGVDRSHSGLYRAAIAFRPPSSEELAAAAKTLRERVPPAGITVTMSEVGDYGLALDAWKASGWRRPPRAGPVLGGEPRPPLRYEKLDAASLAHALAERFDALEEPEGQNLDLALFRQYRGESAAAARMLEFALRNKDESRANRAMARLEATCVMCHRRYRK